MLHDLVQPLAEAASTALVERFVLWINHLLASEPAAMQRLAPRAGCSVRIELRDVPALLPRPPQLVFCITRAGLFEWNPAAEGADLVIRLDASNPARSALGWLGGRAPAVDIEGDSTLAADIHWLADNLRWDLADDLERFVGPVAARELERAGTAVVGALRKAAALIVR